MLNDITWQQKMKFLGLESYGINDKYKDYFLLQIVTPVKPLSQS